MGEQRATTRRFPFERLILAADGQKPKVHLLAEVLRRRLRHLLRSGEVDVTISEVDGRPVGLPVAAQDCPFRRPQDLVDVHERGMARASRNVKREALDSRPASPHSHAQ